MFSTVIEPDDIGIRIPFQRHSAPETPEPDPADIQAVHTALQSEAVEKDYVAAMAVPLKNTEDILTNFVQDFLGAYVMYFMRIKNMYTVVLASLGRGAHDDVMAQLDVKHEEAIKEVNRRVAAGEGSWFTTLMLKEEGMKDKTIANLIHRVRNNPQTPLTAEEVAEAVAPGEKPTDTDPPDGATSSTQKIAAMDPFQPPEVLKQQKVEVTQIHDEQLAAQMKQMMETQQRMSEILNKAQAEKDAAKAEEQAAEEKEKYDERRYKLKIPMPGFARNASEKARVATSSLALSINKKLVSSNIFNNILNWMNNIPMDKILNVTVLREKIDSLVFHHIGFHQGSFVYRLANRTLSKLWFILEPIMNSYSGIVKAILHLIEVFNDKVLMNYTAYWGDAANIFFKYYALVYGFMGEYVIAAFAWMVIVVLWIYKMFFKFLLWLVRFIINIVLSRFGISI